MPLAACGCLSRGEARPRGCAPSRPARAGAVERCPARHRWPASLAAGHRLFHGAGPACLVARWPRGGAAPCCLELGGHWPCAVLSRPGGALLAAPPPAAHRARRCRPRGRQRWDGGCGCRTSSRQTRPTNAGTAVGGLGVCGGGVLRVPVCQRLRPPPRPLPFAPLPPVNPPAQWRWGWVLPCSGHLPACAVDSTGRAGALGPTI